MGQFGVSARGYPGDLGSQKIDILAKVLSFQALLDESGPGRRPRRIETGFHIILTRILLAYSFGLRDHILGIVSGGPETYSKTPIGEMVQKTY